MFKFEYQYEYEKAHNIHPFPAKFPALVPYQIIEEHLKKQSIILDPFSGCGTTLLEGLLAGHHVIGNDTNYIANLISTVKITNTLKKHIQLGQSLTNSLSDFIPNKY